MNEKKSIMIEGVSGEDFRKLLDQVKLLTTAVDMQSDEIAELRRQMEISAKPGEMEYTLKQCVKKTGLGYKMLYKYVQDGLIEARQRREGGTIYVSESALREFRGRVRQPKTHFN